MDKALSSLTGIKPTIATIASGVNTTALVSVWTDAVQEWAALATVLIGVPTALVILLYWVLKLRTAWDEYRHHRRRR